MWASLHELNKFVYSYEYVFTKKFEIGFVLSSPRSRIRLACSTASAARYTPISAFAPTSPRVVFTTLFARLVTTQVRAITDTTSPSDSGDVYSSAVNLMGTNFHGGAGAEEKSEVSSGFKNSSPDVPNTDNRSSSGAFEFVNEMHGSGGSSGKQPLSVGGGKEDLLSNGGVVVHRSGSSAGAGSGRATGYADPVPQVAVDGMVVGGSGGGVSSGVGRSTDQSSASNASQSSGNTYGPLTAVTSSGTRSGDSNNINSSGNDANKFPPINVFDDDSTDSSTLAEEMFARRLGGGRRNDGIEGGGGGRRSTPREQQEGLMSTPLQEAGRASAAAAAAATFGVVLRAGAGSGVAVGGGGYPSFDEHGAEERQGTRELRLSPAEPTANAFPAPMTNAFPASTDTPESEQQRGRGGAGQRSGGVGGGGGGGMGSVLSPSPASSALTATSEDSRRTLLGPSPPASEFMPVSAVEDDEGVGLGAGALGVVGGSGVKIGNEARRGLTGMGGR